MRIVFFGTPQIAVPCLAAVADRFEVVAAVCQPDQPKGRGQRLAAPPVKEWAEAHRISVAQPAKLNDGTFEAWLKDRRPDVCVLSAYGRILKQPILDVPPHGFLNFHPSLLPKYRGPSPIQSAILNGDADTGVTIMKITMEMDSGPILLQERVPIRPDDSSETLAGRLATIGGQLMVRGLELIASGEAVYTPQDEAHATYCKRFEKADGLIHWTAPAMAIVRLVRAAQPWPVAHTLFRGDTYRIHRAVAVEEGPTAAPGVIERVGKEAIVVATGAGLLAIHELQAPGKKSLAVADFLRGHPVDAGERFGEAG